VIDDEPDMRDTLDALLSFAGYEVATADSGAAAVERAKRQAFDLAITDFRMPGMSGADTVNALRRVDPGLAVIVVSGYLSDDSAARCSAEGALRVVAKPFDLDELLHIVADALDGEARGGCDRA
jgi:two-component system response regulator PilR (NtrC family)